VNERSPLPSRAGQTFQLSWHGPNQLICYLVLALVDGHEFRRTWRCLRLTDGQVVWIGEDALASYQAQGYLLSQATA
jgi:hypothetical protein